MVRAFGRASRLVGPVPSSVPSSLSGARQRLGCDDNNRGKFSSWPSVFYFYLRSLPQNRQETTPRGPTPVHTRRDRSERCVCAAYARLTDEARQFPNKGSSYIALPARGG